jgi:hypothetical protein
MCFKIIGLYSPESQMRSFVGSKPGGHTMIQINPHVKRGLSSGTYYCPQPRHDVGASRYYTNKRN